MTDEPSFLSRRAEAGRGEGAPAEARRAISASGLFTRMASAIHAPDCCASLQVALDEGALSSRLPLGPSPGSRGAHPGVRAQHESPRRARRYHGFDGRLGVPPPAQTDMVLAASRPRKISPNLLQLGLADFEVTEVAQLQVGGRTADVTTRRIGFEAKRRRVTETAWPQQSTANDVLQDRLGSYGGCVTATKMTPLRPAAASIFIHNGAPQALVGCYENDSVAARAATIFIHNGAPQALVGSQVGGRTADFTTRRVRFEAKRRWVTETAGLQSTI